MGAAFVRSRRRRVVVVDVDVDANGCARERVVAVERAREIVVVVVRTGALGCARAGASVARETLTRRLVYKDIKTAWDCRSRSVCMFFSM